MIKKKSYKNTNEVGTDCQDDLVCVSSDAKNNGQGAFWLQWQMQYQDSMEAEGKVWNYRNLIFYLL